MKIEQIRKDFPIFDRQINGKPLVYLDSAATAQKPRQVVAAEMDYYLNHTANVHRGIYTLAEEATALYEAAREKVRAFIHAESVEEIIFVRNATEGLNLIAQSWGSANLKPHDTMLLTEMEHHANLLPWQRLARQTNSNLAFLPIQDNGLLLNEDSDREWIGHLNQYGDGLKLVAFPQISNVLGTINPAVELIEAAHRWGAVTVMDAAQSVPHTEIDVRGLDVDFMVFSGHKMLGPTGIGVIYGKKHLLKNMEPFMLGGEMIREVSYTGATWHDLPWKFEAGTPNIAGAIGLGAAIDYLQAVGMDEVWAHSHHLARLAMDQLLSLDGVTVYGPTEMELRSGLVSFAVDGVHAHDVAAVLDQEGIAIRAGHHCAQPLMGRLGITATARASFYIYNNETDVEALIAGIKRVQNVFNVT
jgi:cysteine desulfurase/selenocysteine lyase